MKGYMFAIIAIAGASLFAGDLHAKEIQGQVVTVMANNNSVTIRQQDQAGQQQAGVSNLINLKVDQKAEFKGGISNLQDLEVGDMVKVEGDKAQGQQSGAAAYETYNVKKIEKVEGQDQSSGMGGGDAMSAGSMGGGSQAGGSQTY